jgi:hypothetical protein
MPVGTYLEMIRNEPSKRIGESAMRMDQADDTKITAEHLITLSAIVGITMTTERAEALVPQAEQHFALMRTLDAVHVGSVEPVAEFRLDRQASRM